MSETGADLQRGDSGGVLGPHLKADPNTRHM